MAPEYKHCVVVGRGSCVPECMTPCTCAAMKAANKDAVGRSCLRAARRRGTGCTFASFRLRLQAVLDAFDPVQPAVAQRARRCSCVAPTCAASIWGKTAR